MVFADLTKSRIAELMNAEDVNRIGYWDDSLPENSVLRDATIFTQQDLNKLNSYISTVGVDTAKQQYNVSETGIKIGQSGVSTSNHASNVYTIMHEVALNASYYAAGNDFQIGVECLIGNGVNVINMSAGYDTILNTYDEHAQWIDHISYNHNVHFVCSSGDEGKSGVTAPAMAYNIITVGGANIIGSPPYGYVTSDHTNFMKNGAGVINAGIALEMIAAFAYDTNFVSSTVTHRMCNMYVQDTNVKRVALAYENNINISNADHANAPITNIHYIAEVKLEVLDPSNNVVASCTTEGANLKVLEFTPQTTGTYKIKVIQTARNSSDNSTYFGIAWK